MIDGNTLASIITAAGGAIATVILALGKYRESSGDSELRKAEKLEAKAKRIRRTYMREHGEEDDGGVEENVTNLWRLRPIGM